MQRTTLNRVRAVCAAIAILALFVYLNVSQMDSDTEDSLHTVGTLNTSVTAVLAERHAQAVTSAWTEYSALVVAAFGAGLAVGAPRLRTGVLKLRS